MVASDLPVASPRLKREDCKRTKHDSVFSKWQILVGPYDWEDFSLGKEGAARYRVHNLPKSSGPGVYELGVAVSRTELGRAVGKLDSKRIIVVYLGQADNVRTRLQQYGRTGAHLGNGYFNTNESKSVRLQKGPGLFEDILSRGYPIVFRWAAMDNKRDAEETEAQLLNRFDYAWNTSVNGARRPNDILSKLNKIASKTIKFSDIIRKLLPFDQKQVGVRIKASKLPLPEDKSNTCTDEGRQDFLPRVIKLNRSRPSSVLDRSGVMEENASFCGVILGDGSVCRRPPAVGRKRCAEHGGMRITLFITRLVAEGESESTNDCPVSGSSTPICAIIRSDGSPCRRQPAPGRKRCTEHKGMRIRGTVPLGKSQSSHDVVFEQCNSCASPEQLVICGVNLGNGLSCSRQPVRGRFRCEEHKGLRVKGLVPKLAAEEKVLCSL